jgi:hypothetical protein
MTQISDQGVKVKAKVEVQVQRFLNVIETV